jgi:tetratricopeptide (TPR) repeat protein
MIIPGEKGRRPLKKTEKKAALNSKAKKNSAQKETYLSPKKIGNADEALKSYMNNAVRSPEKKIKSLTVACEILLLQEKWKELHDTALEAVKAGKKSELFRLYLAKASFKLGRVKAAEKECERIANMNHGPVLPLALFIQAHAADLRSKSINTFIQDMFDIAQGFPGSGITASVLYALGKKYDSIGDKKNSTETFEELNSRFPRSPEAQMTSSSLRTSSRMNASLTSKIPAKSIPENQNNEKNYKTAEKRSIFSIAIGPIEDSILAKEIINLAKKSAPCRQIKSRRGIMLYCGEADTFEAALKIKTRLAEEHGINGRAVIVSSDGRMKQVYGE